MTCKWYNVCPLRRFEREGTLDDSWEQNYCKSSYNWRNCKRYQLEEEGIYHPDNMLPNGKIDKSLYSGEKKDCPFCSKNIKSKIIERYGTVMAIEDNHPVTDGHTLVMPIRHVADFFLMTAEEKRDADKLIRVIRDRIKKSDSTVTGFNIGVNCGKNAGQSVMHAHIHIIPRRDGDTPNPKGGVRGVIPGKMGY